MSLCKIVIIYILQLLSRKYSLLKIIVKGRNILFYIIFILK